MRGTLTAIIISAVVSVVAPFGTAEAQVIPGDGLLTVNGAYVFGTGAATGESIDGGGINLAYEKLDWNKPMSFGFSIGYTSATGDSGVAASRVKTSTNSVPLYLGGKYWLGQNKFQFYVGAALGVYFSWLKTEFVETGESSDSVGATGFGMGVPIGAAVSIGETVVINGNYTLNWMWSNDFFDNDLLHAFNIGLGFRLGK
jgi:hypothetical protein